MKVEYFIYLFTDSHGNQAFAVVQNKFDIIQVNGLKGKGGQGVNFVNPAQRVSQFCKRHNIKHRLVKQVETL